MAKLSIEEAQVKLQPVQKAIEGLKGLGLDVPASLQQEFDRLSKIITGSASNNVANTFEEKLAPQINQHAEFVELLANQIGTQAKLVVVVETAEDGTKSIHFKAPSFGGGQKAGTTVGGGTKASTAYNKYTVTVKTDLPDYAETSGTFDTAAKTVAFILNGGKNPLGKGAEWGKGNSMVRVLDGFTKEEAFTANFELVREYVAPVKKDVVGAQAEGDSTSVQA